jgi:transposase
MSQRNTRPPRRIRSAARRSPLTADQHNVWLPAKLVHQLANILTEIEAYCVQGRAHISGERPHSNRKPVMTDGEARDWMRDVKQGRLQLGEVEEQIPNRSVSELMLLISAARTGPPAMRDRAISVLASLRGINSGQISAALNISQRTIFRYLGHFRKGGTAELVARRPRSDKKSNNESIKSAVFSLLHSPPSAYGINRTTWRLADLQQVMGDQYNDSISPGTISTIIREAGWKWRHARIVLTSNDPEYRSKVDKIKRILSTLQPNEAFFSIDEFGPFAIKRKGGVKRVAPGDQHVVLQRQKSKGCLILTAALELSRNQVIHFFSRKKNTDEMIRMVDILRERYRAFRTIYVSWDAASWHVSKDLNTHLDRQNATATEEGFPSIKVAALPAGAQFLNVIESVFSGMARAIIHNSDYPSPEAAIEAIDRYFEQRNRHFAAHPKRAGRKIWGMERVPSQFEEDQNCKDPLYQFPY